MSGKPHCTCTKPAEIGPPLLSAGVVNADRWSTNTELQHNQSVTSLPQIALALFKHEVQRKCNQERINLNPDRKKESRVQRFILIHSDQASTMIRVRERGREGNRARKRGEKEHLVPKPTKNKGSRVADWLAGRTWRGGLLPKKAIRATATRTLSSLPLSLPSTRSLACW